MNKGLLVVFLMIVYFGAIAQQMEWAKSMSGTMSNYCNHICVDAQGNAYSTGRYSGTAVIGPGEDAVSLTSAGESDIFLSKHNSSGQLIWVKRFGGSGGESGGSVAVDVSGNIYFTGAFRETADFDPGEGVYELTSEGFSDIVIVKLDSSGEFVWAKSMPGTGNNFGVSIMTDLSGEVYLSGEFRGTADFDPGDNTFFMTSAGEDDAFVAKLDADGNFLWAKRMGSTLLDTSTGLRLDESGNVYILGFFSGTVDFNPGPGTFNLVSAGGWDVFISKLDSSGNFIWAKRLGGTGNDAGYAMALDAAGNVYTTGSFRQTADFDPGAGVFNLTSPGNAEIFVSKLNSSGEFVWAKRLGGTGNNMGYGIETDGLGDVYITGQFSQTADFDPGDEVYNFTSAGSWDIFVTKLDASGDFVWAVRRGGGAWDRGNSLAIDASRNVYIAGEFQANVQFNPEGESMLLSSAGGYDVFMWKLSQCTNSGTDSYDACDSFTWIDGNTYYSSNTTATHILTNAAGCDSTVTLNLTIPVIDPAVSFENGVLTAAETEAGYTWIDCATNLAVPGEEGQSFEPMESGSYAVDISSGGCSVRSECTTVVITSVEVKEQVTPITIYPNPSSGGVVFMAASEDLNVKVYSGPGQLVKEFNHRATDGRTELYLERGLYLLYATGKDGVTLKKVVMH